MESRTAFEGPLRRSRGVGVAIAVVWALLGGGALVATVVWMVIITLSVQWTTLTHVLMWGALPALAICGGAPAAVAYVRGRHPGRVVAWGLGALLAAPVLLVCILESTRRVGGS